MSLNYLDYNQLDTNENGEYDGIEILVGLAKQGKIDPWNIDIVDVADKYSAHVFQSKAQNLRYTSRVILFAAILLKMKSDILEGIDITTIIPEEQPEIIDDVDPSMYEIDEYIPTNNVISFDEVLERRTSVRLNRNRVVTLRDLIRQLEFYAQLDKKTSIKNAHERAKRRVRNYANLSPDDIVNLAHDEYIKIGVERLKNNLEEILSREDKIELNELILLGMDKITAYLSLLFLAAEGEYDLVQDEFYSDLYVVKYQKPKEEEESINEVIVNNVLKDDVTSVMENIPTEIISIETEEFNS